MALTQRPLNLVERRPVHETTFGSQRNIFVFIRLINGFHSREIFGFSN